MKKVLIIVSTLRVGGIERVAAKTAELLSDKYDVSIAVFDTSDMFFYPTCKIIDLHIPADNRMWKKVLNALRRARLIHKIRKTDKPDCVYSMGTPANLVNVLSKGTGKSIVSVHEYSASQCKNIVKRFIYRNCDLIVGVSKGICHFLSDSGFSDKTVCLYNPHSISDILAAGKEEVNDYIFSPHTIIGHGRLTEQKDWPRLIKAFSLIRNRIPDSRLLIIGDGKQKEALQNLIVCYRLQDSVTLLGFRSNPFAYLSKAAMYVFSSHDDGLPYSLLEAMAWLPVISTDNPCGPREILSKDSVDKVASGIEYADYGILVPPASGLGFQQEITEDDRILAEAMFTLLDNTEMAEAMRNAALKRSAEFTCERYLQQLTEILES